MYSTQSIPDIQLSVRLGDSLKLILLLDGVRVGRSLGGVDKLIGKTLGDRLGVVESGFTGLRLSAQCFGGVLQLRYRTYTNGD